MRKKCDKRHIVHSSWAPSPSAKSSKSFYTVTRVVILPNRSSTADTYAFVVPFPEIVEGVINCLERSHRQDALPGIPSSGLFSHLLTNKGPSNDERHVNTVAFHQPLDIAPSRRRAAAQAVYFVDAVEDSHFSRVFE